MTKGSMFLLSSGALLCRKTLLFIALLLASTSLYAAQQEDKAQAQVQDQTGQSQPTQSQAESETESDSDHLIDGPDGRSGYAEGPPPSEGRDSVVLDLYEDDIDTGAVWKPKRLDGVLDPYWDWKRGLKQKYGLKLQVSYQSLGMWLDDSPGEDDSAAGRFEFQGAWTLTGKGTPNTGMVTFRAEYRDTIWGADIPPSKLSGQIGSAGLIGTGFSDFGWAFRELAWRQTLAGGKVKFATGKISAIGWYNSHALSSPKRGFQNSAMMASNARPFPGRGLGLVVGARLSERWGVVAGIHDANAVSNDNPLDTIDEKEFFQTVEFHYFPTTYDRHRWDQVRVQLWHQDERRNAGIPSGQGVTFVASKLFQDRYMPFVYGGYSDGEATQMEADLGVGLGYGIETKNRAARDLLAIGVNWGRPSNPAYQDQFTTELFYRFQLLKNIAFTPSVQYIKDPIAAPESDDYWVFGFRWRMTF